MRSRETNAALRMPRPTFTTPLFSAWRHVWDRETPTRDAGRRADHLAEQRNALRPADPAKFSLAPFSHDISAFYRLVSEGPESPLGGDQNVAEYIRVFDRLKPVIDAARWPRWLLLEQAFDDANRQSDFILAALVLRTMIEDFRLYVDLEECERQLAEHALSHRGAGPAPVVRRYAGLLACRMLPRVNRQRLSDRPRGPETGNILNGCYQALNDYVHPNYGSHVAAIMPEECQVGSLLLSAFGDIYDGYFGLSWVKSTFKVSLLPIEQPKRQLDTAFSEWQTFFTRTLPGLRKTLTRFNLPDLADGLDAGDINASVGVFAKKLNDHETVLRHDPELLESATAPLRNLCDRIAPNSAPHSPISILEFPRAKPAYGFSEDDWVLQFSGARQCATNLEEAVKNLDPNTFFPGEPPYSAWIEMMSRSIELALTLGQLQESGARRATVRMLSQRNPLGAALAGRSMLEHVAVSQWISTKLERHWKKIEDRARQKQPMKPVLDDLEGSLCRFLAGTKGTQELATAWRQRWAGSARGVSLSEAVNVAFPGQERSKGNNTYDHLSEVVHGEALRGGDLLGNGAELPAAVRLGQISALLMELMDPYFSASSIVRAVYVLSRMTRPEGPSQQEDPIAFGHALARGMLPKKLWPGTDYVGSGTQEDPIQFTKPLDHHFAVRAWCQQAGVMPELCEVWPTHEGLGTIVAAGDRRLWFSPALAQQRNPPKSSK